MPSGKISFRDFSIFPSIFPLKIAKKGNFDPSIATDTATAILAVLELPILIDIVFSPFACTVRVGVQQWQIRVQYIMYICLQRGHEDHTGIANYYL